MVQQLITGLGSRMGQMSTPRGPAWERGLPGLARGCHCQHRKLPPRAGHLHVCALLSRPQPVGNACRGDSHGPQRHKAPRPSGAVALPGECDTLRPSRQHGCRGHGSQRSQMQPLPECARLREPEHQQAPSCLTRASSQKGLCRACFQWQAGGLISPECCPLI